MSDVEKIVDVNWRRRKWAEEAAANERRVARQQAEAKKRVRRYELYRTFALLSAIAAGTGLTVMSALCYAGMRLQALVALTVTAGLVGMAFAFDGLREENTR